MHTKECEESRVTKTEKLSKFTSHPQYQNKNVTSKAKFIEKPRKKIFFFKGRKFTLKNRKFGNPIIGPEQECTPNQQRRQNLNIHNIGNKYKKHNANIETHKKTTKSTETI